MSALEEQEETEDPEDFELYQESGWVRFIEYLQTPQGDGRLGQAIEIYKESSSKNLDAAKSNVIFVRSTQAILLLVVIIAASILAYCDKFNPTISLLFGTIVGYFFGKK